MNPQNPLNLEAQQLILNALLNKANSNSKYSPSYTSNGNTASYQVIVRQYGTLIPGSYMLVNVDPSAYNSIICIYYNDNVEIIRTSSTSKPGSCIVSENYAPGVTRLVMQVIGIYSAPTGGSITLRSTGSNLCTTMSVDSSNAANSQIITDQSTGKLIWSIVTTRLVPNVIIYIQQITVQSSMNNIGLVEIVPYARSSDTTLYPLNSLSGQINTPITGFPTNVDIGGITFIISPSVSSYPINANQMIININFCYSSQNMLLGTQPYYMQNPLDNIYNTQTGIFISIFLWYYTYDYF